MIQDKMLLPRQADERSHAIIARDLDPAEECYLKGDRIVLVARERFSARLENALWERYRRDIAKVMIPLAPMSYPEWLIKRRRLENTYATISNEPVWYHLAGLLAEAKTKYQLRGESNLPADWYMPSFIRRINHRQPQTYFKVHAHVIWIAPRSYIDLAPTIVFESRAI